MIIKRKLIIQTDMLTLRCCVIDDEPLAAKLIAGYVEKTPYLELVGSFASAQEAVKCVLEENIDLVFLDINMPQLNGMEFAKIIPSECKIVFTTAYDNYAIEGFKVNAVDYLLKPVSYEEFVLASNKALRQVEMSRQVSDISISRDFIIIKSEYKLVQIHVPDILYIEGLKDYVKIYVESDSKCIMTLMSMRTLERSLPSPMFLRVHRSFIVNTSKIKIIERNRIIFGKTYIPISETYKQAFSDLIESRLLSSGRNDE